LLQRGRHLQGEDGGSKHLEDLGSLVNRDVGML